MNEGQKESRERSQNDVQVSDLGPGMCTDLRGRGNVERVVGRRE